MAMKLCKKLKVAKKRCPIVFFWSSIKFQGHTGWKMDDLNRIWVRLLGWSQLSNPSDLPGSLTSHKILRPWKNIFHWLFLDHWLSCQDHGWGHMIDITSYRLTSLLFNDERSSHSWDIAISKFDLENPSSRSYLKVTYYVQYPIDSHPFHSMQIGFPVPEIQQFQKLTLKIQGQGHGWDQSLKSQCESNILSTHFPFVQCQWALPFLKYSIFKISPWKSKVKVIAIGHIGITSYRLISLSFDVDEPLHSYIQQLKNWPWKSKAKVMGEVNVESHNMCPTFYRLTSLSFHVNRPSHSWDTTFSKFDLENLRSRSWLRSKLKVTKWV